MKIFTIAHVPDELANDWLQHLRDFDSAHEGCHFEVAADAPDMSLPEMVEAIRVEPGLSFTELLAHGPRPMRMIPVERCFYCMSDDWEKGPRGGASLNITCKACGARFNVLDHDRVPQWLLLETLSGPTRHSGADIPPGAA